MKPSGLSLVETLVALLLAAVTMAAAARTALAVEHAARTTELLERASFLAARELEDEIARGPLGLAAMLSFDLLDDPLGRFERHLAIEPGPRPNLWQIEVTVVPPRGAAAVSFRTLLRRPWWQP